MPDPKPTRPTGEILVLMVAGTVCVLVVAIGVCLVVLSILDPTLDTAPAFGALRDAIGSMVGLCAGYIAGRGRRER